MATRQEYQLQTMPPAARPPAARHDQAQSRQSTNAIMSLFNRTQSSQFRPGLLSRPQAETGTSFFHKLNSVYTAVGLVTTLALAFFTLRLSVLSWQLSRWTARKDYLELCLELKQANLAISEDCTAALADGLAPAPTFRVRRWLDDLSRRVDDWASGINRNEWDRLQDETDNDIRYGGLDPGSEVLRDELIAEHSRLLVVRTHTPLSWIIFVLISILLVVCLVWPVVRYLAIDLRRNRFRDVPYSGGEHSLMQRWGVLPVYVRIPMILLDLFEDTNAVTASATGFSESQPQIPDSSESIESMTGDYRWLRPTRRGVWKRAHKDDNTAHGSLQSKGGPRPTASS